MFNRYLKVEVAGLRGDYELLNNKYWDLWRKHEMLLQALGLVEEKRSIQRYIKKGGPEQSND